MPSSKEDILANMPREQLETVVMAAQQAHAEMRTKLDDARLDAKNWHIAADGYAIDARKNDEDANFAIGMFLLVFCAWVITLICLLLLIFGVI